MKEVYAAKVSDFDQSKKKRVVIDGMDVLIVQHQGVYYAVENTCPHMGGSLYDGNLEDHYITCPKHGSVFDVVNGDLHEPGKLLFFKVKPQKLKSFPVKIVGDDLMVEME
jgi:3-phenylpropionate/trans-cinnamate dioxygenase ferredoxin subunit